MRVAMERIYAKSVLLAACLLAGVPVFVPATAQDRPTEPSASAQVDAAGRDAAVDPLESVFPLADSPDAGRELVEKAFALIGSLVRVQDLTRERLEAGLGVRFIAAADAHGTPPMASDYTWNQRLTPDWWMVGMNLDDAGEAGRPSLSLVFVNLKNREAPMTSVCADLYRFAPAMVKTYGYAGKAVGTDPQHIHHLEYVRPDNADSPVVELYLRAEHPDAPDRVCLKSIVIR